jgi:hypothetical protein
MYKMTELMTDRNIIQSSMKEGIFERGNCNGLWKGTDSRISSFDITIASEDVGT